MGVVFLIVIIIIAVWVLASCIRIVPQAYAVILERLGAYQATWSTGIHFKIPFIERVARKVNLKEQVVDFPPQPVMCCWLSRWQPISDCIPCSALLP